MPTVFLPGSLDMRDLTLEWVPKRGAANIENGVITAMDMLRNACLKRRILCCLG